MAQKPKMKKDAREGMKGVVDSIYNMYEDHAKKGNLGPGAKLAAEERAFKRGDQIKRRSRNSTDD